MLRYELPIERQFGNRELVTLLKSEFLLELKQIIWPSIWYSFLSFILPFWLLQNMVMLTSWQGNSIKEGVCQYPFKITYRDCQMVLKV